MKKTLVSALTTAIVVGAASTTFAAANPFEDVPADHWAYDAIAQLAADGVIEGYGDGTYRGDQEITRYEMAQMIARAMAKGGGDKALIDKLAAEFADELNNLGVRVAALEKKVDNVRWKGWVGYEFYNINVDRNPSIGEDRHQYFQLQLNPTVTINKNWIGRARLKYYTDANTARNADGNAPHISNSNTADNSGFFMDRVWVQGNYDNLTIQLGKIYHDSPFDGPSGGMVFGNRLVGGIVTFGNKLKTSIGVGRFARDAAQNRASTTDSMQFLELGYEFSKKFSGGIAYYHTSNKRAYEVDGAGRFVKGWNWAGNAETGWVPDADDRKAFGSKDRNILEIGMTYKFSPKWLMNLAYAQSNGDWDLKHRQAYNIEFSYNGGRYPDMSKKGNFGGFVAYRHLGRGAVIAHVYDGMGWPSIGSTQAWEVGVAYVFDKNIMGTALYSQGQDIAHTSRNYNQFYGALQFYF